MENKCLCFLKKINSRWILDLNVRGKTIKLLEGNIREYFHELGTGKDFLNSLQKVLNIKENVEIGLRNI